MLTPVADGVFVHRSELLRNLKVVVHGRAGAWSSIPGSPLEAFTKLDAMLMRAQAGLEPMVEV